MKVEFEPLSKDEIENGIKAWENIKKQAQIDFQQAVMYIKTLKEELKHAPLCNGKGKPGSPESLGK